jgi:hypothetical protein
MIPTPEPLVLKPSAKRHGTEKARSGLTRKVMENIYFFYPNLSKRGSGEKR